MYNYNSSKKSKSFIAFKTAMAITIPSVYIKNKLYYKWTSDQIASRFNEAFGQECVDHVDMITQFNDKGHIYYKAYVHFGNIVDEKIFEECGGFKFIEQINAGNEEVRFYYDYPKEWYWKLEKNRSKKYQGGSRPRIIYKEPSTPKIKDEAEHSEEIIEELVSGYSTVFKDGETFYISVTKIAYIIGTYFKSERVKNEVVSRRGWQLEKVGRYDNGDIIMEQQNQDEE